MKLTKEEISRKVLHLFALLIPAGIFYVPVVFNTSKWLPGLVLGFFLLISLVTEFLRLYNETIQKLFLIFFKGMMRKKEEASVTGSTYIFASGFICSVIFVNRPEISFISLFIFILGDAAAALVGIEFGRIKIKGKSLEGSCGCFLTCFILLYFVFPLFPLVMENFSGSMGFYFCVQTAFLVTILELYPIKIFGFEINDNLYVPVLCGAAISFI